MDLTVDPDDLTFDELEEFEDLVGTSVDDAFGTGQPRAKAMKALVWIMGRRSNPELTLADVGAMKISEVMPGELDGGPADPAPGSASRQ